MKNIFTKSLILFSLCAIVQSIANAQQVATFEDLTLDNNSEWHGKDNSGRFFSGGAAFVNEYYAEYDVWAGFAYSNKTDKITEGFTNQYSVYNTSGYNSSATFAVVQPYPVSVVKPKNKHVQMLVSGFYITNMTYTVLSMQNGYFVSKKFGGSTGNDKDSLVVTAKGYINGVPTGDSVNFVLADYRFDDNSQDYIVDTWEWFDLTSLGYVDSIGLTMCSSDNGEWGMNTPAFFAMDDFTIQSTKVVTQFAPAAGKEGSTAMHKDSSAFTAWASACEVIRGPQDISGSSSVLASSGTASDAIGKAGSGIVSLGDGGVAVLTFNSPIVNGPGNDFAVFENGFNVNETTDYLELAFVEVSSDGENFFRFPSVSLTPNSTQLWSFEGIDPTKIHNLAGKYVANYGTPFDLEELKNTPGLDVNNITHVKIIDVVGSIQEAYASKDSEGNVINDPWPTAFISGGFDLDGVGVIHSTVTSIATKELDKLITVYPNPARQGDAIKIDVDGIASGELAYSVFDYNGNLIITSSVGESNGYLPIEKFTSGLYIVKIGEGENQIHRKLVIIK